MLPERAAPEHARLKKQRDNIVQELFHLRELIQGEVDLEPDEGDEQITEHETAAILVGILEQRLHDIDKAIASIERGRYHYCERCGDAIEPARLAAKPDARYCLSCQLIIERITHSSPAPVSFEDAFLVTN